MQDLISPIKREILLAELSEEIFVRKTNKGDNEIYIFRGINKPN